MPPGPNAKDPSVRARRNTTTTRSVLSKPPPEDVVVPPLPEGIDWYAQVVDWWEGLWGSEPRGEWIDADTHLLFVAARLYQMMLDPETKATAAKALAGEYRQILVQFGLTPMARRSLQWEVSRPPEEDKPQPARKPAAKTRAQKAAAAKADPRARFKVVK